MGNPPDGAPAGHSAFHRRTVYPGGLPRKVGEKVFHFSRELEGKLKKKTLNKEQTRGDEARSSSSLEFPQKNRTWGLFIQAFFFSSKAVLFVCRFDNERLRAVSYNFALFFFFIRRLTFSSLNRFDFASYRLLRKKNIKEIGKDRRFFSSTGILLMHGRLEFICSERRGIRGTKNQRNPFICAKFLVVPVPL